MVAISRVIVGCVIAGLVALMVGLFIGYYGIQRKKKVPESVEKLTTQRYHANDDIVKYILKEIDGVRIDENLKELTKEAHPSGTPRDEYLAKMTQQRWKEDGLDEVNLVPYNLFLPYPTEEGNQVYVVDEHGVPVYTAANKEKVVKEGDIFGYARHGYSPAGTVTAPLVYVNFARVEDFDELQQLGVNVSGHICLARYGQIFRGNKVKNAQERGAVGVILFSDPSQVAIFGTEKEDVYPNTWWMPGDAMQRGSVKLLIGDPLTPGYPSVDNAYRYDVNEVDLPRIPSQPIGYADAKNILSMMGGPVAPTEWQGKLDIDYRLGPGFNKKNARRKVKLVVNNKYEQRLTYNVIGLIKGETEPDRYVILGNHRDAWVYGAVDPSSATAQMFEVTRVIGQLHKNGWTPKRTLVFCSWVGEEYGLLGSTEWVEEHIHQLTYRAVGYINVDTCTRGDYFYPAASPILRDALKMATKQVSDPIGKEKNLFNAWKAQPPASDGDPYVWTLGSGTDHAPFSFYGGVPAIAIMWVVNWTKFPIVGFPSYHTAYETYEYMKFIDPDYTKHKNCAHLSSVLLHILSNSRIIPYNLTDIAIELQDVVDSFGRSGTESKLKNMGVSLHLLKKAIQVFHAETENWHNRLHDIDIRNPLQTRWANDRMMMVERVFVKPDGLPNRPFTRNVAFAPSKFDRYSGHGFPAIEDLLYGYDGLSNSEKKIRKEQIERHISDLTIILNMATKFIDASSMP